MVDVRVTEHNAYYLLIATLATSSVVYQDKRADYELAYRFVEANTRLSKLPGSSMFLPTQRRFERVASAYLNRAYALYFGKINGIYDHDAVHLSLHDLNAIVGCLRRARQTYQYGSL